VVALSLERGTFTRAELDAALGPPVSEDQPARWVQPADFKVWGCRTHTRARGAKGKKSALRGPAGVRGHSGAACQVDEC
jgi:hypothetical protein